MLRPEHAICEKVMSLVCFSCGENPVESLKNKVRHICDLHQLLGRADYDRFLSRIESVRFVRFHSIAERTSSSGSVAKVVA